MTAIRVYIATTEGPSEVQRIVEEEPSVRSVVCLDGKAQPLPITPGYENFVRKPVGVIERLVGHGAFRMDVAAPITGGMSWQLGALAAHILHAAGRLVPKGQPAGRVLWATGEVDADLNVGRVDHVAEKIAQSGRLFSELAAKGVAITLVVPAANRADVGELPPGIEVVAATTAADMLRVLGLDELPAGIGSEPAPPPKVSKNGGGTLRALAFVGAILVVVVVALGAAAWQAGYLPFKRPGTEVASETPAATIPPVTPPLPAAAPAPETAPAPTEVSAPPAPPPSETPPEDAVKLDNLEKPLVPQTPPPTETMADAGKPLALVPGAAPPVATPAAVEKPGLPEPPAPTPAPKAEPVPISIEAPRASDFVVTAVEGRVPRFHECRDASAGSMVQQEAPLSGGRWTSANVAGLCWVEYTVRNAGPPASVLVRVLPPAGRAGPADGAPGTVERRLETGESVSVRVPVHVSRWRPGMAENHVVVVAGSGPLEAAGEARQAVDAGAFAPLKPHLEQAGMAVLSLSHVIGQ